MSEEQLKITCTKFIDNGPGKGASIEVEYNTVFENWFTNNVGEFSKESLENWIELAIRSYLDEHE